MTIETRMHQVWVGWKAPEPVQLIASWRAKHPDWLHILWRNEKGWPLQRQIDAYVELNLWSGVGDLIRWCVLWEHGGIALDADSECLRPLDERFREHEAWSVYEHEKARPGLIACGAMGFTPRHPIVGRIIDAIEDRSKDTWTWARHAHPWRSVGPAILTELADDDLHVFPAGLFYP